MIIIFHPQGEDICLAAIREVKEETGVSYNKPAIYWLDEYSLFIGYKFKCEANTVAFILLQIETEFVEVLAFR